MKLIPLLCSLVLFSSVLLSPAHAEEKTSINNKKFTHFIAVWLKEPRNAEKQAEFVKISESLNDLPDIIHRHVGIVSPSERVIVDDTFDAAITVTFKNKAALERYLNHPRHKKVLAQIKPLVNRVVAHDFVSP